MHGVPPDLDLSKFQGATLIQLAVGGWDLQFHFAAAEPGAAAPFLQVEGRWELRDASGAVVDEGSPGADGNAARAPLRLNSLLGARVVAAVVRAPVSFTLGFDNGESLRVYDSSPEYESFSIQPGDVFV